MEEKAWGGLQKEMMACSGNVRNLKTNEEIKSERDKGSKLLYSLISEASWGFYCLIFIFSIMPWDLLTIKL